MLAAIRTAAVIGLDGALVDVETDISPGLPSFTIVGLGEPSKTVRGRVTACRQAQQKRFKGTKLTCNAELTPAGVRSHCQTDDAAKALLRSATTQLYLSARAFHRVLKLARTIADLVGAETIGAPHLAEALQYRPRRLG